MHPRDYRTDKEKLSLTLTPSEVAKMLGVSAATVRGWGDTGVLPPLVISRGGRYQFTEEQISACRNDEAVRDFLRKVLIREASRNINPIPEMKTKKKTRRKRRPVKPVPDLMTQAQAAEILCVSRDTLRRWRVRKVFLPLVVLPNRQPRYSKLQVTAFRPDVVYAVATDEMWQSGPGHEKWLRGFQESSRRMRAACPLVRELWPHSDHDSGRMSLRMIRE